MPRSVLSFVVLACALSWGAALLGHGETPLPEPVRVTLRYLAKFGPSLAGLWLALREGWLRDLLARAVQWRVGARWYAAAILGPFVLWGAAAVIHFTWAGEIPAVYAGAAVVFVPLFLKHLFLGGALGEELGWRGYMLPALQERWGGLGAAIVVGIVWGLWHAPAFFVAGTGKEGGNVVEVLLFTALTTALSVLFTWLWSGSARSLLVVMILHASLSATENTLEQVVPALDGAARATFLYGGAVLLCAIGVGLRGRLDPLGKR